MEQFSEFFENLAFMTFSHDRFWVLCAIIVAVILVYQLLLRFAPKTVGPVHHFLQRHPLIWICIPAALLIYFVYVSLGWNLWVSVSDWESGQLEASYGWGGFGNYAKMFSSPDFWPSLRNTLLLGIALSIDALITGFTIGLVQVRLFAGCQLGNVLAAALIIGLSALVISAAGIGIGRKASSRLGAKAEVFGGLILIAIGTRILLEHLGVIG